MSEHVTTVAEVGAVLAGLLNTAAGNGFELRLVDEDDGIWEVESWSWNGREHVKDVCRVEWNRETMAWEIATK
jgi:hypothetical protein